MLRFTRVERTREAGVMQLGRVLAGALLPLVMSFSSAGAQDACAQGAAGIDGEGWSCGGVAPDLDLTLPVPNPGLAAPKKPLPRDIAVEEPSPEPLPIAITPGESGASARASLSTLRDYNAQISNRKLGAARAGAGETLVSPKGPVAARPALDVWSSIDAQGFDGEEGRTVKTGAGLDYKVVPNTSVGVVAERSGTVTAAHGATGSEDEKVAAYVAFKALPAITLDARTTWERAAAAGSGGALESAGAAEKSAIVVAPRLDKSFALDGGTTIAPFLEVKREIDLSATPEAGTALPGTSSAGAGVTFAKPGSYALSVTTGVTGSSGADAANVNGKVEMKLPLD